MSTKTHRRLYLDDYLVISAVTAVGIILLLANTPNPADLADSRQSLASFLVAVLDLAALGVLLVDIVIFFALLREAISAIRNKTDDVALTPRARYRRAQRAKAQKKKEKYELLLLTIQCREHRLDMHATPSTRSDTCPMCYRNPRPPC